MDTIEFLQGQPLFAGFSSENLAELVKSAQIECYQPRDSIITPSACPAISRAPPA
jgi:signal-transduction protein with cAMP-binding, CBS, and nucleotidyltransferase domain